MTIEKIGKVWVAKVNGVTICSCSTKAATEANARYLERNMTNEVWRALCEAPSVMRRRVNEAKAAE
jgi:hypothetical protein